MLLSTVVHCACVSVLPLWSMIILYILYLSMSAASDPERNNMFNLPDIVGKLAANPKTREYLADPSYMNMLKSLSENPQDMGL